MELIEFESAKLAKEKGFNEMTFYYYNKEGILEEPYNENGSSTDVDFRVDLTDLLDYHNNEYFNKIAAPYQSQLQKWLRNKYGIHINVCYKPNINKWDYDWIELNKISNAKEYLDYKKDTNQLFMNRKEHRFDSYEEALEQGLLKGLKLINNE